MEGVMLFSITIIKLMKDMLSLRSRLKKLSDMDKIFLTYRKLRSDVGYLFLPI